LTDEGFVVDYDHTVSSTQDLFVITKDFNSSSSDHDHDPPPRYHHTNHHIILLHRSTDITRTFHPICLNL